MIRIRKPDKQSRTIAITLAIVFALWIGNVLFVPIERGNGNEVKFEVKNGDGLTAIAANLKKADLIKNSFVFSVYVSSYGKSGNLKAGLYSLNRNMSISQIARIIIGGFADSNDYQVLLAEGFNIWEIDRRLAEYGMSQENEFAKKYLDNEGYLFPDTYRIARPTDNEFDLNIISDEVFNKMRETFNDKTSKSFDGLSEKERKDTIIIASMLEKEARSEKDMKLVAGIIKKRLENDWYLQIDATVSYGACLREFDITGKFCDVSLVPVGAEIKIDGPYNSYKRMGLPPGPIANPGLKAINAAMRPEESAYWYYLTSRDGQMIYSRTGVEHEANRSRYLGL